MINNDGVSKINEVFTNFKNEWDGYSYMLAVILNQSLVYTHNKKKGLFNGSEFNKYREIKNIKPLVIKLDDSGGYGAYIRPVNIIVDRDESGSGTFKVLFNVLIRGKVTEIGSNEKFIDETVSGMVDMLGYNDYEYLESDVLDYLENNKFACLNILKDKINKLSVEDKGDFLPVVQLRARSHSSAVYLTSEESTYNNYVHNLGKKYIDKNNLKKNEEIFKEQRKLILSKIRSGDKRLMKVLIKHNDEIDVLKLRGVSFDKGIIGKVEKLEVNQNIIHIDENRYISILPHRVDVLIFNKDKTDSKLINVYNIINYTYIENEKKLSSDKIKKVLGSYQPVIKQLLEKTKLR